MKPTIRLAAMSGALLACICTTGSALAQPAGDDCAAAQSIACNSSTTFDNTLATTAVDDPPFSCHFDGPDTQGIGTVWFSFTATDTSVLIETCASTGSGDTEIALYEGTCGAFTELACDEDGCDPGFLSILCAQGLTIGNTYYIQVASYSAFEQGLITLDVTCPCPGPPANDECEGAISVDCDGSVTFDNSEASTAPGDPGFSCHFDGPGTQGVGTMWFSFVATDTSAQVETCASTGSGDTEVAIYDGTCGSLTELACNEDACGDSGFLSRACAQGLTVGNTYLVQVASFSEFSQGSITLDVVCPCPAGLANDECEGAQPLECDTAVTVDNTLATLNSADPLFSCGFFGPSTGAGSLWYSFVATHESARLHTCNSAVEDTLIAVYDGLCGSLVEIGCNEDGCRFLSDVCVSGLIVGNTYLVQVASFNEESQGAITLELQCPCPAPCDGCLGDANGDSFVDGRDIQDFVECYLAGGEDPACGCADVDRDGAVNDDDVAPFVERLLNNTGLCNKACAPGHEGQLPDTDTALNSAGNSFESADNFVAAADGDITAVRWWGVYAGEACPSGGDTFRITYYNNFNGRPGDIKAGPFSVSASREATDLFIDIDVPLWAFDAVHAPVAVSAGECVWISIVNDQTVAGNCCLAHGGTGCDQAGCQDCVCLIDDFCCDIGWDEVCVNLTQSDCAASCPDCSDVGGGAGCIWFWSISLEGDGFLAQTGLPNIWEFDSRLPGDLAWCLDVDISEAVCPEPTGVCCTGADCADTTQAACAGEWTPDFTCGEFTCPLAQFGACCAGDACVNTQAVNCAGPFFVGQDCAGFTCPVDSADCCVEHPTPGCLDLICELCVCDIDVFCCEGEWDGICVEEAIELCTGSCTCAVPGACCDGVNCFDATSLTCAFAFFPNESCATFACPGTAGACCVEGVCTESTVEACLGFFFAGQACEAVVCPTDSGDCCVAHAGVGCQDAGCESCVCGIDPFCCDSEWDGVCVLEAQIDCVLSCTCVSPNDCCAENATPGCNNAFCQACVCFLDPFCCETAWDEVCAGEALNDCPADCACPLPGACCDGVNCFDADSATCEFNFFPGQSCATFSCPGIAGACCVDGVCSETTAELCGGFFFSGQACEGLVCPIDSGNCCVAHATPGCEHAPCNACVCGLDPFCCNSEWDSICVNRARIECDGPCVCPNPNDCCVANATPGCGNAACQACVCADDPFCCDSFEGAWDNVCAGAAAGTCQPDCNCP